MKCKLKLNNKREQCIDMPTVFHITLNSKDGSKFRHLVTVNFNPPYIAICKYYRGPCAYTY